MAGNSRLMRFRGFSWLVPVCIIVGVVLLIKPLSSVLNSLGSALKGVFDGLGGALGKVSGAVDAGTDIVTDHLGLDQSQVARVKVILSPPADSFWNLRFFQRPECNGAIIITAAKGKQLVEYVESSCQSFMGGVDDAKYRGLFSSFPSQAYFSCFLYWWQYYKGSQWQEWAYSGWLGGIVSSLGKPELCAYDAIVSSLPVKTTS